jgi:N6-L-threonylcarbamoyladenine synthase
MPWAAAMARCIIPDWVSASFEPRVPILTRGCLVTTRQIPPSAMTRHTILGIETSCDETAAAVVRLDDDGASEVLSSVVASQIAEHAPFGGVVPEIAARAHVEIIDGVIRQAMAEAGLGFADLTGVAATAGPGLVGGVMVGLSAGKAIALARGLPLVAVNHLEGHAVSARLGANIPYPFLLLLVSGGHCQLLRVDGVGACVRLGSTIDDAAGEAFDKIAKTLGLPYPGGPALEQLAEGGDAARYPLPRALLGRDGCDFSFSGLKTAAARVAETLTTEQERRDHAASVQAAIARQLADRTAKAMKYYSAHPGESGNLVLSSNRQSPSKTWIPAFAGMSGDKRFVVAGGVAANSLVRSELQREASEHGFSFHAPPLKYCTDNAAMIALAGAERLAAGMASSLDAAARPRWPLDEAAALANPMNNFGRKGAKA